MIETALYTFALGVLGTMLFFSVKNRRELEELIKKQKERQNER